jgi:hypothetical protein
MRDSMRVFNHIADLLPFFVRLPLYFSTAAFPCQIILLMRVVL